MLNIFFISNDDRIARLIEYFQPRFRSKIRWVDNFDHGLKEVFENRPSLVFIQNSINSVSGETVARHIKSLLGSVSPKIVYLDEAGSKSRKNASWCDAWMRMAVSEQQFRDDFAALVSRLYPDDWREDSMEAPCGPVANGVLQDPSMPLPGIGDVAPGEGIPGAASGRSGTCAGESLRPETSGGAGNGPAGTGEVSASSVVYDGDAAVRIGVESARPGFRRFSLLAVLLAVAAFAVYFLLIRENKVSFPSLSGTEEVGKTGTVAPADRSTLREKARAGLPSFIRPEWRDKSYASAHPGWERYVSPQADFRIYRNGGTMKALQIVAPEGRPLSDPYRASVLSGLGYLPPARAAEVVSKDGFLMETAALDDSAEIVTYRESDGRAVRALVIVFP